jgi:hypothetical protein
VLTRSCLLVVDTVFVNRRWINVWGFVMGDVVIFLLRSR